MALFWYSLIHNIRKMKRASYDNDFQWDNVRKSASVVFSIYLLRKSMKTYSFTFYLLNYARAKGRTRNLLLLIVLMLTLQVTAHENWSLNECITHAIQYNLQLRQADLGKQIANQNYQKTKWNLLSGIGVAANAGINSGRSVDLNTDGIIKSVIINNTMEKEFGMDPAIAKEIKKKEKEE